MAILCKETLISTEFEILPEMAYRFQNTKSVTADSKAFSSLSDLTACPTNVKTRLEQTIVATKRGLALSKQLAGLLHQSRLLLVSLDQYVFHTDERYAILGDVR